MRVDYHVHIERGPYTFEWLDRFMETARQQGIEEVGIVEHSHIFKEMAFIYEAAIQDESMIGQFQQEWLAKRMNKHTLSEYLDFLTEAQRRGYPVKGGLEICYFPKYAEATRKILQELPVDFIIGSLHWLDGWGFDQPALRDSWVSREKNQVQSQYHQALRELISLEIFDIVGHIDSIKAFSPWQGEEWLAQDLVECLKKHGLCVEINTGLKYRRNFAEFCPTGSFLQKCCLAGIPITLSSDAHDPLDVGKVFHESIALAKNAGYTQITRFDKRQQLPTPL